MNHPQKGAQPQPWEAFAEISALQQSVENLESWQTRQNGTLQRLETKIDDHRKSLDGLRNWIMGALFTSLLGAMGWVIVLLKK